MVFAPGTFRLARSLGPRPFASYPVRDEQSLVVDTGVLQTPEAVKFPCFGSA